MSTLTLEGLSKRYGSSVAVEHIDLAVAHGELVALLGPSGCGKTTTLRMAAGFVPPSSGRIAIDARDVTRLPPQARDTAMVFQSYALFPHMSVAQNVGFGLEMRKVPVAERAPRVRNALRMVRMEAFESRLPRELSGGQQQRVALARALVVNPSVLLLDEPLSNLDAKLRSEVRGEIRQLQKTLGLTMLIVTHDQEEALAMADRLVVMEAGKVRQIGSAEDLYERPADAFVAGFVGRCNLVPGVMDPALGFRMEGSGAVLPCNPDPIREGPCLFTLRPERLSVRAAVAPGLPGRFVDATYLGPTTGCRVEFGGHTFMAVGHVGDEAGLIRAARPGDPVSLHWPPAHARLLPRPV